jgi:hypothetical protein
VFIASFASDGGAHVFSRALGDLDNQRPLGLAVDAAGDVFVVGKFRGTLDFGGGALVSVNDDDAFVVKLDKDGKTLFARSFGGVGAQAAVGVASDPLGGAIVVGNFSGDVDLGRGRVASAGASDFFLAKLAR